MRIRIVGSRQTEDAAQTLAERLTAAGHAVTLAVSAKDLFADGVPDLVHACGAEAAAAVSAACVHQHVPLVATEPDVPAADALSKRALIRLCRSFSDADALFVPDAAAAERLRRLTGYPVSAASDANALTAVYEDVLDSYRLPPPPVPETGEPLVSVILPVYNTAQYLTACLDSLLGQTYRNLEILAVDDGSTDGSGAVLDAYAQKDVRLRVFHRTNHGMCASRNFAMLHMTGDFIGFVDSDDYLEPDRYQTMVSTMQQTQADLCNDVTVVHYEDGRLGAHRLTDAVEEGKAACLLSYLRKQNVDISCCSKLYRRTAIAGLSFDESLTSGEEYLFNMQAHSLCRRRVVLSYGGYHYIRHDASCMHKPFSVKRLDTNRAADLVAAQVPPNCFGLAARRQIDYVLRNYWEAARSDLPDKAQLCSQLRDCFQRYLPRVSKPDLRKSRWYLPSLLFRIHPKLFLLAMRMLRVAGVE